MRLFPVIIVRLLLRNDSRMFTGIAALLIKFLSNWISCSIESFLCGVFIL
jgi:hypothetical protein